MGYDCSITNRKGCNYCLREKPIYKLDNKLQIIDEMKTLFVGKEDNTYGIYFDNINYCPICGRKL